MDDRLGIPGAVGNIYTYVKQQTTNCYLPKCNILGKRTYVYTLCGIAKKVVLWCRIRKHSFFTLCVIGFFSARWQSFLFQVFMHNYVSLSSRKDSCSDTCRAICSEFGFSKASVRVAG